MADKHLSSVSERWNEGEMDRSSVRKSVREEECEINEYTASFLRNVSGTL